ncbi:MAG: lipid III flippase WzxE [Enterobacteriaceae bacterium]|jgi:antigen flippase|nr:lipid III flippase WzxE [Enterobacteriaceae bacterium]
MSLAKASVWTAGSTLIKIGVGLLVVKLLAVSFGPTGVGQAGNFRQLITVLGVLSGAGIFNGVTKYVAENHQQPEKLRAVLGTSSSIILGFSTLLAIIFLLFSDAISIGLFGHNRYKTVVQALAFIQMGIAYANYFLAILKGFRDAQGNALAIILGSLIGVVAYGLCYWLGGYEGALAGLALVPALVVLPAGIMLLRNKTFVNDIAQKIAFLALKPAWDRAIASHLGKFTLMALLTSITLPVAYVMMRNLMAARYSWEEVGIWQGVSSISDAYLQFITASFTVYLLPTLARLESKRDIAREIVKALKFVLPAVAAASFSVWLLRDFVIWFLFSDKFTAMRELFAWQLVGDVLKVCAYVFGYLVVAKAALRFYVLAEISQFLLLVGFSHWLIPVNGALGAAQSYMATYIVYFSLCCGVFIIYCRRA